MFHIFRSRENLDNRLRGTGPPCPGRLRPDYLLHTLRRGQLAAEADRGRGSVPASGQALLGAPGGPAALRELRRVGGDHGGVLGARGFRPVRKILREIYFVDGKVLPCLSLHWRVGKKVLHGGNLLVEQRNNYHMACVFS